MSEPEHAPAYALLTDLDAPNPDGEGAKPAIKRIHKSDSETVVRLSFRAGQEMAEHLAAHPIVVLGQAGAIDFTVQGETFRLEPGSAIRVDARVPHALRAVTDGAVTLIVVHGG
ncbi:cupin domain-containing protein [Gordonia neofelifaecis]|uniref:Cupin 2 conserved barrel domain-containing protein n=1 Tax=Gordonia neofelifaecis NRRL B-59395 TaxID=644548 RepID=F1YIT0_9ACTN|nr:cupin domain-containing protein [Gordonia neofelifaecis]EGD55468.1 Cupin 2 conserved barrel domain-containing protein [Gordonia neofelifaecis NRRL B-59395]